VRRARGAAFGDPQRYGNTDVPSAAAGYARGHPDREAALGQATRKLAALVEEAPAGVSVVLENTCEGSELGADLAEMGRLVREVAAPPDRLGVLIDTCHLHAAGSTSRGPTPGTAWPTGFPARASSSGWSRST